LNTGTSPGRLPRQEQEPSAGAVVEELAAILATPAPPDAFVFTAPKGGPLANATKAPPS
jgi:hypothetical protein